MPLLCIIGFLNSIYGVFGYIFQWKIMQNGSVDLCPQMSLPVNHFCGN